MKIAVPTICFVLSSLCVLGTVYFSEIPAARLLHPEIVFPIFGTGFALLGTFFAGFVFWNYRRNQQTAN